MKELEAIEDVFAEFNLILNEIDDNKKDTISIYLTEESLKPYTAYRQSILSSPIPIDKELAISLLSDSFVPLSNFGKNCPVLSHEEPDSVQTGSYSADFPVYYNSHLFLLSSENARKV